MWGSIALIIAGIAVWLWLRSLGPGKPAGSDSVVQAAAIHKTDVRILYGTQTGTATGFAKTLQREANRLKLHVAITDLEEYSGRHLADETIVIFVVSTYGEGEAPDAMRPFYDWLMQEATEADVSNVKFAVFGLGDRQYKYFAAVGVKLDEQLQKLGAERICGLGTGDAGQNLEEEFDQWRQDLWPAVGQALGVKLSVDSEEPVEPEFKLKVWEAEAASAKPFPEAAPMMEPTQAQPAYVTIDSNEELLSNTSDGRSTRLISMKIDGTSLSYQAGDHLGILPCNTDELVNQYLKRLGVHDADQVVSIVDGNGRNQLPTRQPVRVALKWFLDLAGPPKKAVLRAFAHYCTDAAQKQEMLQVLRTSEQATAQYHKLQHSLRNVLGFLNKFSSCQVPLGHFLELMPRLAPRYFSISSDLLFRPTEVRVTVAVVEGGVCTTMLANSQIGDKACVFVRKSTFHLPLRDKKRPVIMIGPGTGVAPLIGFLERREAWVANKNEIGPAALFFGCRNRSVDYIHRDFLEGCLERKTLTSLDVAFSRDQSQKVYVQHRIAHHAAELWNLIQAGANIYICGDARHMAKDVEKTLLENVFQQCGGLSADAANELLQQLQKKERYLKDVWSA